MKRFFVSACAKIGCFFWSWGFLKFCLWAVTLIILFYAEEDWRGARAWAATKAEWEAKGESFDYNKLIPPPIPDDQNLAAIPLLKLKPSTKDARYPEPVALRQADHGSLLVDSYMSFGHFCHWEQGELPDREKIQNSIAHAYAKVFKTVPPSNDSLAQFDALYPFTADLRAAATERPLCRFLLDYTATPHVDRPLGLLTEQLLVSEILTLHAILALDNQQSDLALQDFRTSFQLASGVERDPSLIGDVVAEGMTWTSIAALYDGLALHAWSDAQLAEIDQVLRQINFLSDYQHGFRCEAVDMAADIDYWKKNASRSEIYGLIFPISTNNGLPVGYVPLTIRLSPPWAGGWWENNKSQIVAFDFRQLAAVDPVSHRVFPDVDIDLQCQYDHLRTRWDAGAPWNILFTVASGAMVQVKINFAKAQVWVDETRIACALERYRLAHNAYPDSLDALIPAYASELPHDIFNGQPYRYRLRPDGTFLLYSVGWNQTDDGGVVVYKKDSPNLVDYQQGDWVWPTVQPASAK